MLTYDVDPAIPEGEAGAWFYTGRVIAGLMADGPLSPESATGRDAAIRHVLKTKGIPRDVEASYWWIGVLQSVLAMQAVESLQEQVAELKEFEQLAPADVRVEDLA